MRYLIIIALFTYCTAQDTLKVERVRTVKDTVYIVKPDTTAIIQRFKSDYDKNVNEMLFYINEAIIEWRKKNAETR